VFSPLFFHRCKTTRLMPFRSAELRNKLGMIDYLMVFIGLVRSPNIYLLTYLHSMAVIESTVFISAVC